jgi:hypothetical protein
MVSPEESKMASPEQAQPSTASPRPIWLRISLAVMGALLTAWLCGVAMKADARLTSPPGFFRGLLHGGMMPVAWPTLLAGQDQVIYAERNSGRTYKLGYSMGVNLSGLIFFGWLFLGVAAMRKQAQRQKLQSTS